MHPFMAAELLGFSLEDALSFGTLPLVVMHENRQDVLNAYVNLYLDEEVKMESLTRNVDSFVRFLEARSVSHASQLNISSIARECSVNPKVVESYVQILDDLLLSFSLPVFKRRPKRKTGTHRKFYFFDTGVFQSLRPRGPLDQPSEIHGAALVG